MRILDRTILEWLLAIVLTIGAIGAICEGVANPSLLIKITAFVVTLYCFHGIKSILR